MTARLFFDASLAGVAQMMAANHPEITYPANGVWELPQSAKDEEWLEAVGRNGWCAIIRDKKIRSRPEERAAMERFRAKVVNVAVRRNLTSSEYVDLLERHWDGLEKVLAEPPAYYHLTKRGLVKLHTYPT